MTTGGFTITGRASATFCKTLAARVSFLGKNQRGNGCVLVIRLPAVSFLTEPLITTDSSMMGWVVGGVGGAGLLQGSSFTS